MKTLLQLTANSTIADDRDDWLINVEAVVADNDDPERRHRVRLIIPSIDEDAVYDKWADQLGVYCGGPGYGSFALPPIETEVRVFGRLGQKHNISYLCVYNEDHPVPEDFEDETVCGVRAPADMKFIAEGDMQLRAGGLHIESDGAIKLTAPGGFFVNGKSV